ncbi:DUF2207 domain-containing protein [Nitratiruptor tergarcus]|uniref:Predicted membrane protein n=1 Tax=Nitratiruptor tergarcus DSM 16512 TaxID=1069081 RepID=A0A1W1WRI1_9BACT|nr:DUF2207 domain-containing protein [Nitratiruptor tergarcus]SMC08812.1 Predicted membrane protein [Nitratiruptor tergarcus DSM 16512]
MKKILLFFIAFVISWAEHIENFKVDLTIYPDGSLHVQEDIVYNFGSLYRHGIYRDIPNAIKTDFLPKDIGLWDFKVLVDGQESPFEIIHMQQAIRIKIGDPNRTITGKHHYTISYNVAKGVLYQDEMHDAVRWNAIGTEWRVPISYAKVTVHLPPILSKSSIQVRTFLGRYGSTKNTASLQWLDDHTFEVEASKFDPHEGLTVEIAFPRGLLGQSGLENQRMGLLDYAKAFIQYPLLLLFLLYLFFFYKDHATSFSFSIHPVYKPPKDIGVLEAGLLYDRFAETKDFPASVIELAVKGFVSIEERDQEGFFANRETLIKKTAKKPQNLTPAQNILYFQILFPYGDTFILKKDEDIAQRIRSGFQSINQLLYDWSVKEGYFQENPQKLRIKFLAFSIFLLFVIFIVIVLVTHRMTDIPLLFSIGIPALFVGIGVWRLFRGRGLERFLGLWFIFIGGAVMIGFIASFSWQDILLSPIPFILIGVGAIFYIYRHIGLYTPKGVKVYRDLLGLKEFIQRAKAAQINYFLQEDPYFLDKLLPFAMLFDLTKHWLKFYEQFHSAQPSWYHGNFYHMQEFSENTSAVAAYAPSNSVGGGGSFSGGGSGGGGGGSW